MSKVRADGISYSLFLQMGSDICYWIWSAFKHRERLSRPTVQSGSQVTDTTVLRLKVRIPDTALGGKRAGYECGFSMGCSSTGVTSSTHAEPTGQFPLRTRRRIFRGHRCTGFWRTLAFQSTHPSGSQRKSRTRGKGSHRRHFLTTRGHYYDSRQTLWSLRGAGNGLA